MASGPQHVNHAMKAAENAATHLLHMAIMYGKDGRLDPNTVRIDANDVLEAGRCYAAAMNRLTRVRK